MPDPNRTISVPMFNDDDVKRIFKTPLPFTTEIERNITPDEIQGLKDRVAHLEQTIKHIFGNHVLVNGKWVAVK